MKRTFLMITIFLVSAGVALGASRLSSVTATSTTTTAAYAIAVAQTRAKPVLMTMTITATDPLADVVILDGNGTETLTTAAISASATTFGVSSCTGLDETTTVVIGNSNGDTLEVASVSACNSTLVMTVSALTNAYRTKARVSEIDTLWSYSDVGAGTQVVDRNLIGYSGGPLVGQITAATGTATIDMTVDYR